jgi:subtilase family serine protease
MLALAAALLVAPAGAAGNKLVPGQLKRPDACELLAVPSQVVALAGGHVSYTVKNVGSKPCPAFKTTLSVGTAAPETLSHGPLAAGASQQQAGTTQLAGCGPAQVRVVVDAQQQAAEPDESNNTTTVSLAPPCPDLVSKLYSTDEDGGLRYQVHVKVTNEGAVATPRSFLVLVGLIGLAAITPPLTKEIGPLAPGESKTFSYGPKRMKTNTVDVSVRADRADWIEESNEDNNYASRTFGPH